jgi:hypothetical protein
MPGVSCAHRWYRSATPHRGLFHSAHKVHGFGMHNLSPNKLPDNILHFMPLPQCNDPASPNNDSGTSNMTAQYHQVWERSPILPVRHKIASCKASSQGATGYRQSEWVFCQFIDYCTLNGVFFLPQRLVLPGNSRKMAMPGTAYPCKILSLNLKAAPPHAKPNPQLGLQKLPWLGCSYLRLSCPQFDANLLCFFAPAPGLGKPLLFFAGSNISLVLQADWARTKNR